MPFETDGFFSKEIGDFRRHVRTTEPFKAWFDYATTLVQLGLEIWRRSKRHWATSG